MEKNKQELGLMPKASKEKVKMNNSNNEKLAIVESFQKMVENDDVEEFILFGVDEHGQIAIASYCSDTYRGVGMFEMGKLAFINQQTSD
jgi:hypothetical protein